jgi:hypothetical protein
MIVEYKMNRSENGYMIVPPWVECPGFFQKDDHTYIGFVSSEANREFYVPDTVTYLTVEELKTRVRAMSMVNPETESELTDGEKDAMVDAVVAENDLP